MNSSSPPLTDTAVFNTAKARFSQGDLIGVLDLLDTLSDAGKTDPLVRRLRARTLAQSGQPLEARSIVIDLLQHPEQLGDLSIPDLNALIGRTWKDEWESSVGSSNEGAMLDRVIECYQHAYQVAESTANSLHDLYYAAINVATFAQIAGRHSLAQDRAVEVLNLCKDADAMLGGLAPNAWPLASRAEAHALLGHLEEAQRDYATMKNSGLLPLRDLCSVRKQARLLAMHTGEDRKIFDTAFNLPSIVVFAGHRLDAPMRQSLLGPRLPLEVLGELRVQLDQLISSLDAQIGYSSAAAGSDIVFIESMQAVGAETHILLSSPEESFRRTNITNVSGGMWDTRFDEALKNARSGPNGGSVMAASPHEPSENSISYMYANLIMSGQAWYRSRSLDLDMYPVAVWDELPGDGPGGTADFCHLWEQRGLPPKIINPRLLTNAAPIDLRMKPAAAYVQVAKNSAFRQEIKAILFADVKNFSKLGEDQVELFSRHYLGRVSEIIAQPLSYHVQPPLVCNTWGDAFYMVFDTVRDAGVFALRLQQALVPPPIGTADWTGYGLPANLSIRIALHAGPVFLFSDPVIRNMSFTGRHVSFGARLEPVTPSGQVYASDAFASLAVMDSVEEFRCDYMGMIAAAKDFGSVRAFRVSATPQMAEKSPSKTL